MEILALLSTSVLKGALVVLLVMLPGAVVAVYSERRLAAFIQMRIGPNRVGPFGLFQAFADVTKLIFKEDIVPAEANRFFHTLAPLIAVTTTAALFAVIPFADYLMIGTMRIDFTVAPNVNLAVLYILAVSSVAVYALTFAGWSSGSKYSLLGSLRSSAQMISYELTLGSSLIGIIMMTGSMNLGDIVRAQADFRWNIFLQPLGFLIFLVSSFAETNRAPFDLVEAEPELVGGYHTEYTGMKFGLFMLVEFVHIIIAPCIITTLFLGGWQPPVPSFLLDALGIRAGTLPMVLLQLVSFTGKVLFMMAFFIWVRWSLPRFRYDQLMNLGWKVMLPLSLLNIIITALVVYFTK
ncbi:MAG: NADH-quinone oxidoreductase subunit NuoH [Bacteroidota bacterium]|nr:NADH-quinone oxidoreductase subunit NuoH [Candidatus Kapabacteria bacterium]MDW8220841.1 NADH-quinone oxidoreductase subunit NuoH [Bacteroidota bacterium]